MPFAADLRGQRPGPFGGVAGVTKTIPAGSLRHVDQNIETAYAHFYGLSFQHELSPATSSRTWNTPAPPGRKLYDLADPNKRGAAWSTGRRHGAASRPNTQYAAFNTRGNRGESEYHGVTFSLESRRFGNTGLQFTAHYTLSTRKDNLSSTFSDSADNFNLGYLDAFDPMLDWGDAEFDVRHRWRVLRHLGAAVRARRDRRRTRPSSADWQLNFIFNARTGFPFTL